MDGEVGSVPIAEDSGGFAPQHERYFQTGIKHTSELWKRGVSIDLGSQSLRVATWDGAEVEPRPQLEMPARVAITTRGKVLLGHEAKSAYKQYPGNAFTVGTLLAKLHQARDHDPEGHEPPTFVTAQSIRGKPQIFLVLELLALLIRRMRDLVQKRLELPEPHQTVVLCIPACCGRIQRQALKDAALLAGFVRVRLMCAPLGVALWRHYLQNTPGEEKKKVGRRDILIVDIGAIHIDCAYVVVQNDNLEALWASGIDVCAGREADHALALYCLAQAGIDKYNPAEFTGLSQACEKAKRTLSAPDATTVTLNMHDYFAHHNNDAVCNLSANDVEQAFGNSKLVDMLENVFRNLIDRGDQKIAQSGAVDLNFIDEVLLVGHGSKVPCVKRVLQTVLNEYMSPLPEFKQLSCPKFKKIGSGSAAVAHANVCGGAVTGALLGDGLRKAGAEDDVDEVKSHLDGMQFVDCFPFAIGIDIVASRICPPQTDWLVEQNRSISTSTGIICWAKLYNPAGAVLHFREDASVGRDSNIWLGALVVPVLPRQDASAGSDDQENGQKLLAKIDMETDDDGHFGVTCFLGLSDDDPSTEGLSPESTFIPRCDVLTAAELASLTSYLETQHATDRCMHYGLRPRDVLPARVRARCLIHPLRRFSAPGSTPGECADCSGDCRKDLPASTAADSVSTSADSAGEVVDTAVDSFAPVGDSLYNRDNLPDWPMDLSLVSSNCNFQDASETEPDTDDDAEGKATFEKIAYGRDSRTDACVDRLRQKLNERRNQMGPMHEQKSPSGPQLSSDVCAVCLCSEKEIGRPFPFVMQKCGHKCLCKPCMRKMRASQGGKSKKKAKIAEIECPLCRTRSKPVLSEQHVGEIFTSKDA